MKIKAIAILINLCVGASQQSIKSSVDDKAIITQESVMGSAITVLEEKNQACLFAMSLREKLSNPSRKLCERDLEILELANAAISVHPEINQILAKFQTQGTTALKSMTQVELEEFNDELASMKSRRNQALVSESSVKKVEVQPALPITHSNGACETVKSLPFGVKQHSILFPEGSIYQYSQTDFTQEQLQENRKQAFRDHEQYLQEKILKSKK